jgi:hypothetical protein
MSNRFVRLALALIGGSVMMLSLIACSRASGKQTTGTHLARTPDGRPDLSGIWQAINTADWDLLSHAAGSPPIAAMGARGARSLGSIVPAIFTAMLSM